MLRPRIVPCLLVSDGGLVKTRGFAEPKYVGDPINAVKIFNEKGADELMVVDIDATARGRPPDPDLIRNLAVECRMPLCYGGGVRTVKQAAEIVGLGVEKVAVSSAAISEPGLVRALAREIGGQSVVVVLDVRRQRLRRRYSVHTHNGTRQTGIDAIEAVRRMQEAGAGEIVVNSIDRDGQMDGYDLELAEAAREACSVPLTVLGGAGSIEDLEALVSRLGVVGAAAGSLFVFKGPFRAVLISYPALDVRERIARAAYASV